MRKTLILVLGFIALPRGAAEPIASRPNIIIILADDLGYGEPTCYGGNIPTPNIDSLARSGVRFTDAYVTAPFCAASRSSLLTGRHGVSFGFEFNPLGAGNEEPGVGLALTERTLADVLRGSGYATAAVGKWHLGGTAPFHPQRRGFDEFFGFLHEGHYYVPPPWTGHTTWLRRKALPDGSSGRWASPDGRVIWSTHLDRNEDDYDADNPLLRSGQPVDEKANLTDAFTREAVGFIERHSQQPFFLYVAYNAVHSPMQASDTYLQRFGGIEDIHRRIFAAMLTQLDDGIGRIIETLRARGLEERTLIAFLSDNGGPTSELTSSNLPLRGGKGQLYEGGIRVPLILQWKGHLSGGRTERRPAGSLDLFPTASAAAGIKGDMRSDGVDLMTHLMAPTEKPIRETHYWRVGGAAAMRHANWKIVRHRGAAWELYNLDGDIAETRDLAAQDPEKLRELEARWNAWNKEQPAPPANPNRKRP